MRYLMLAAVVLLIILLDVFLLALPQWASINDMSDQSTKLTQDTQQVLVDRQRINLLKKNLKLNSLQLKALSDKVRSVSEVPGILATISSIANEYGVKIDQLAPDKSHQETLKTPASEKYYALPVLIRARCGYHMFGRFLNKLEKENFYFIMKDFIIQSDEANPHIHSFSLTIKLILVNHDG